MSETKERVVAIISSVLDLEEEEMANLRTDVGYKQLSKWTSARHAEIIVAIEDEFDFEIEERAIPRLNDVPKIVQYVDERAP